MENKATFDPRAMIVRLMRQCDRIKAIADEVDANGRDVAFMYSSGQVDEFDALHQARESLWSTMASIALQNDIRLEPVLPKSTPSRKGARHGK